ncbi:MAG TPA: hypothetical protein VIV11_07090, partial [Kofleriaceae bacterium]
RGGQRQVRELARGTRGMHAALPPCMNNELETLEAAQLEHVTGGFDIGGIANFIGGALEKAGVQGAGAAAQKYGGMAQDFLSKIMGGGGQPTGGGQPGGGQPTAG